MRPIADRFWEKVNFRGPVPDHRIELVPCWVWTGFKNEHGYGDFFVSLKGNPTHTKAPRVSWFLFNGEWPDEFVLHHCDNPGCVRPGHLFEGTQADNGADMRSKNRHRNKVFKGEDNGWSKLTWKKVREMRALFLSGRWTYSGLARKFGTVRPNAARIIKGTAWKEIA